MESLPKVLTIAGSGQPTALARTHLFSPVSSPTSLNSASLLLTQQNSRADSGGGAGIQADLKTIAALGCYGTSAVTAITAQNTLGVFAVEGISTGMVAHQIQLVLDDIGTDAIKTGMLFSQETINVVVETLENHFGPADRGGREKANLVVDPVCVSTSGHSLLPLDAVDALRKRCLPWATVVTPNIPEAEFLAGWERGSIQSVRDMERCAAKLGELGVRYVYLKGGHMPFENAKGRKVVVDLLWDSETRTATQEERPFLDVKHTLGTGCTLAAAIAAELAKGRPGTVTFRLLREIAQPRADPCSESPSAVPQAVVAAANYVAAAIAASYPVGAGAGPVNHFHSLVQRTLPLCVCFLSQNLLLTITPH